MEQETQETNREILIEESLKKIYNTLESWGIALDLKEESLAFKKDAAEWLYAQLLNEKPSISKKSAQILDRYTGYTQLISSVYKDAENNNYYGFDQKYVFDLLDQVIQNWFVNELGLEEEFFTASIPEAEKTKKTWQEKIQEAKDKFQQKFKPIDDYGKKMFQSMEDARKRKKEKQDEFEKEFVIYEEEPIPSEITNDAEKLLAQRKKILDLWDLYAAAMQYNQNLKYRVQKVVQQIDDRYAEIKGISPAIKQVQEFLQSNSATVPLLLKAKDSLVKYLNRKTEQLTADDPLKNFLQDLISQLDQAINKQTENQYASEKVDKIKKLEQVVAGYETEPLPAAISDNLEELTKRKGQIENLGLIEYQDIISEKAENNNLTFKQRIDNLLDLLNKRIEKVKPKTEQVLTLENIDDQLAEWEFQDFKNLSDNELNEIRQNLLALRQKSRQFFMQKVEGLDETIGQRFQNLVKKLNVKEESNKTENQKKKKKSAK